MALEAFGSTFGVEEEFLLVDAESGRPVPRAPEVLADGAAGAAPGAGAQGGRTGAAGTMDTGTSDAGAGRRAGAVPELKHELPATQVESATGVCTTLAGLAYQVLAGRERLAAAADRSGALLLSTGTPPLSSGEVPVTEGDRFRIIRERYAGLVADYQACGCHVHVGVDGADTAVAVVGHLRPWLPTLLALSANSPFDHGRDTGYASWRMVEQSRFPGAGMPPRFASAAAYEREVDRLVACGVLVDDRMSFWLARPSPRFATVELRAADAAQTVEETLLQAALSRALVRTALSALAAGREPPYLDDQVAAAALWSASRHGLRGPAVHPLWERQVPAAVLVESLLEHVGTALEESGDAGFVRAVVSDLVARGTGAERQRAAGVFGADAAVRYVARQTAPARRQEAAHG